MENVNVVIVDDNPMILNTLDEMISSEAGLSVIGRQIMEKMPLT